MAVAAGAEPSRASTVAAFAAADVAPVEVRFLGRTAYADTLDAMRAFTAARDQAAADEIWVTQHDPVFTQGLAGKAEHVLAAGPIPVVATDRGGQVTYHGPGQVVAYLLVDLQRRGLKVRELVHLIEAAAIATLRECGITGHRRPGMPGVYVGDAKVAALGLKVRRGCSYHGMSLNVDVDLAPFGRINPCGYPGLAVTRIADLRPGFDAGTVAPLLAARLRAAVESRKDC
jgi:lipoyl(octanoyl) transferase